MRPILVVVMALAVAACAGPEEHQPAEEEGGHEAERHIRLDAERLAAAGVLIAVAGPGPVDAGVALTGAVHANPDALARVTARFPGVVREVRRRTGDVVRAGDVLAVVESDQSLAPYELRTPIDGTVIDRHFTRGAAVDSGAEGFVVADLGTVAVELAVHQEDLDRVGVGSPVRLAASPGGVPEVEARVVWVGPVVDEATRTATARVVLSNPDGRWRPGVFVTGRVLDPVPAGVVVPRAAVQTIDGRPVVFVETDDGIEPRPVALGRRGETRVEVTAGLAPGDRYAAEGSFVLKAELGAADAEHGH